LKGRIISKIKTKQRNRGEKEKGKKRKVKERRMNWSMRIKKMT
jgi:hypothetical protein